MTGFAPREYATLIRPASAVGFRDGAPRASAARCWLHLAEHPQCAMCGDPAAVVQQSEASIRALCSACAADDDRARRLRLGRASRPHARDRQETIRRLATLAGDDQPRA